MCISCESPFATVPYGLGANTIIQCRFCGQLFKFNKDNTGKTVKIKKQIMYVEDNENGNEKENSR